MNVLAGGGTGCVPEQVKGYSLKFIVDLLPGQNLLY